MGNKVKYNLKNVHAAKLTEMVADGETTFTYAAPKAIPGAVSISLDAEGESSPFYADGIVYFRSVTNNGYSGDLEIDPGVVPHGDPAGRTGRKGSAGGEQRGWGEREVCPAF